MTIQSLQSLLPQDCLSILFLGKGTGRKDCCVFTPILKMEKLGSKTFAVWPVSYNLLVVESNVRPKSADPKPQLCHSGLLGNSASLLPSQQQKDFILVHGWTVLICVLFLNLIYLLFEYFMGLLCWDYVLFLFCSSNSFSIMKYNVGRLQDILFLGFFPASWDIIGITFCKCNVYAVVILYMKILQNDCHNKVR